MQRQGWKHTNPRVCGDRDGNTQGNREAAAAARLPARAATCARRRRACPLATSRDSDSPPRRGDGWEPPAAGAWEFGFRRLVVPAAGSVRARHGSLTSAAALLRLFSASGGVALPLHTERCADRCCSKVISYRGCGLVAPRWRLWTAKGRAFLVPTIL